QVRHGNAHLADLAPGQCAVGVVAGLGREIESDRETGLALRQVRPVQLVGGARRGVSGIGTDEPGTIALGHRLHSPGSADCGGSQFGWTPGTTGGPFRSRTTRYRLYS